MPLLNYTTTITAAKTAAQVTTALVKAGATQILTEYADGSVTGIAFALAGPGGVRQYRLPVDPDPVLAVLRRQGVARRYANVEQAQRVAWRIVKDWVDAQIAIVETRMAAADQVFLPYMLVGGDRTIYEMWAAEQQLALEAEATR